MEPIFTDKQLNNMSREDLISLMKIVQEQTKKKDTEIQLLKDKQKELYLLTFDLLICIRDRRYHAILPIKDAVDTDGSNIIQFQYGIMVDE